MQVQKGQVYQHFKGNYYYIEDIAYDSASNSDKELQKVVVYRALYGDNKLWVRPYNEFISDKIMPDGSKITRFKLVEFKKVDILDRNI